MGKAKRSDNDDDSSDEKAFKRYRVTRACTNCQRAHVSCEQFRPCKRCTEKGFPATCMDGIQRKRGKKKRNAPETTEQSAFEHEWYHARSAEAEPAPQLDWSAVASAIPTPVESAQRKSYTFVHFDPDTGEYVEESQPLITPEMFEAFWLDTSHTHNTASSPAPGPLSPFGFPGGQPPFNFNFPRRSSFVEIPKGDAEVLVAAAETAEEEEQVKREIFRQSFDLTDGHYDPVFVPSSPDIWGRMQEAVEAAHSHDPHGRRNSFFIAPMPQPPTALSHFADEAEGGETEREGDASFILWKLGHEHEGEGAAHAPIHQRDHTEHLKTSQLHSRLQQILYSTEAPKTKQKAKLTQPKP